MSAPAVQRRIKRMTEAGVVQANVAIVDPAALGHPITIFVDVEVIMPRGFATSTAHRFSAENLVARVSMMWAAS